MSKALAKMFEPVFAGMAKRYQSIVGAELSKYGLRYDDLLDETMNLDVAEALRRLPQEERDLRMQRLKRAMDLSMKHVYLDKDQQKKQTPFAWYVTPALEEVEAERDERAALGTGQPYNRQIP
jgi:ubiquinol-cytochrome c reductase subunit 7